MPKTSRRRLFISGYALAGMLFFLNGAAVAQDDPPSRVARLSYLSGDVTFAPAGENEWDDATTNRPLIRGDRVVTRRNSRAVLDLGSAELRVDSHTGFHLLALDDENTQVELNSGTLNLRIDRLGPGERFEIDTPKLAFVVDRAGAFRIDAEPQGGPTTVTVFAGGGTVYGENQASRRVDANHAYRIEDASLRQVKVLPLPRADEFDHWTMARDERLSRSVSRRYVPDDVVGVYDLDEYGDWEPVPDYGHVWFPRAVAYDWAPYRHGHWGWVSPWGWTWIDDSPWGFAPSHYGRWAHVHNRWGWVPGPRHVRAVYAPAVVAFFGGHGFSVSIGFGQPVGWFPLSPYDVYVPWYRTSRHYFNRVNVANCARVQTTVINNYYDYSRNNRHDQMRYAYRHKPHATTVVAQDTFVRSRPVRDGRIRVDENALTRASLTTESPAKPTSESMGRRPSRHRDSVPPPSREFERSAAARTARGRNDVAHEHHARSRRDDERKDDISSRSAPAAEAQRHTASRSEAKPREQRPESNRTEASRSGRSEHPTYSAEQAYDPDRRKPPEAAAREERAAGTMPSSRFAPRHTESRRSESAAAAVSPPASNPGRDAYDKPRRSDDDARTGYDHPRRDTYEGGRGEHRAYEPSQRQSRQSDAYQAAPQSRPEPPPQAAAPAPAYSEPHSKPDRAEPAQRSEQRSERPPPAERREARSARSRSRD